MTRVSFGFTVSVNITASDHFLLDMLLSVGQGPTTFVIQPDKNQAKTYFSLSDLVKQLGTFLKVDALTKLGNLKDTTPPPWNKIFEIEVSPRFVVSIGKAENTTGGSPPSGFQCILSLYDNGQYGIRFGGEIAPGVTIEPNFTVYDLIIGYNAAAGGLGLSARVEFEELQSAQPPTLLSGNQVPPKTEIVSYPFANPPKSTPVFQICYLGLGQHFGPDLDVNAPDPIAQMFTLLEQNFTSNNPTYLINTLVQHYYKPDRNWFIAADIYLKGWRVRAIFNDPVLYGVEITCGVDNFKGLLLEILYQKLGPNLGVYFGELILPDMYRQIQLGVVSLTIPSFKIWIYTNGDFKVSVGWPLGPNSLGIQVYIFTGGAGFYFAKLRSGDTPQSANSPTNYNPILAFGLALSLGVGRSINEGVFSAQLSLTLQGTFQGILAWQEKSDGTSAGITSPPDYYWFAATVGLVGVLQGSVDLKVITASVLVQLSLTVGIAFESDYGTEVVAIATVDVDVSLRIVFFTIHVGFHATIQAEFRLISSPNGQDASLDGPRNQAFGGVVPQFIETIIEATFAQISLSPGEEKVTINLYFLLQPTAIYDTSGGTLKGVAMLLMPTPSSTEHNQDFLNLLTALSRWLLRTYSPNQSSWAEVVATLTGQVPANFEEQLTEFLTSEIVFVLHPVDLTMARTSEDDLHVNIFPMFDQLQMLYTGTPQPVQFSATKTPSNYEQAIAVYFNQLSINGLMSNADAPPTTEELVIGETLTGPSVTHFIFFDYFLMIARDLAKRLNDTHLPQAMPDKDMVEAVGGLASRFLLGGLRLPDPNQIPTDLDPYKFVMTSAYALTNQQFSVDDTLTTLSATLSLADTSGLGAIIRFAAPSGIASDSSTPTSVTSVMPVHKLPPAPAPQWSHKALLSFLQMAEAEVQINQLPGVKPQPMWFTVRRPLTWSAPDNEAEKKNYLVALPTDILGLARQQTLTLTVQTSDPNSDPKATSALSCNPSLLIQLRVSRVQQKQSVSVNANGKPVDSDLENLYQLSGTDDQTREMIDLVLKSNAVDLSKASIRLLYNAAQTGYQSDTLQLEAHPVFTFKTNLSTSSQPDVVNVPFLMLLRESTPGDIGLTSATLTDVAAFLQLLWEVSVVHADGFYLYYADGQGKGLPGSLFKSGPADLTVLVEFATNTPIQPYHNFVTLHNQPTLSTSLFVGVKDGAGNALVQYNSMYPPGCIGFTIDWSIQTQMLAAVDSPNTLYDNDWVVQLYHLIQFQIQGSGGSQPFQASLWSTALSPTSDQGNVDHQDYRQVVPIYQFAGNAINSANNVYAAIGGQPTFEFYLEDIFGNQLAVRPYNVNFPVLYHDRLIPLQEWPGVSVKYRFLLNGQTPTLRLIVSFDPNLIVRTDKQFLASYNVARRTNADPETVLANDVDKINQQAQVALHKYRTIIDQYADPNISLTLTTSVLVSNGGTVGSGAALKQRLHDLAVQFAGALQKVTNGSGQQLEPISQPIDNAIDITDVQKQAVDLFPVTVILTLARPEEFVDPTAKAYLPATFNNSQVIRPYTDQVPPPQQSENGLTQNSSFGQFTLDFETAFANFDGSGGSLKLATRSGLDNLGAAQDVPSLWAARMSAKAGIHVAFDQNSVSYFTLAPLSTNLINQSAIVPIYDHKLQYREETRIFSDIDIDAWAKLYLSAVDSILSSATAAAIADRDPTSYATLMQHKAHLADAIAHGLIPVYEAKVGQTQPTNTSGERAVVAGDWQSAHDQFEQALLASLSRAYTTSAVVQLPAEISIAGQVDSSDIQIAPRLFGSVLKSETTAHTATAPSIGGYTFTNSKLNLISTANGQGQYLNFLASVSQPQISSNLSVSLDYVVSYCEALFDIPEEEYGYLPSSWLKFVRAGKDTPLFFPLGQVDIPIPLREFPARPILDNQSAGQSTQTETPSEETAAHGFLPVTAQDDNPIAEALKWDYRVHARLEPDAQDELWTTVTYNQPVTDLNQRASFMANRLHTEADYPGDTTGLFQALARFFTAYPVLQPFVDTLAQRVFGGVAGNPNDPTPEQIIQVIVNEITNVSTHWAAMQSITDSMGNYVFPVKHVFTSRAELLQAIAPSTDLYVIQFPNISASQSELKVFAAGAQTPFPTINGQTITQPVQSVPPGQGPDNDHDWYQATIAIPGLPNVLEFQWARIEALVHQTANTQFQVVRNRGLSDDPTLVTNPHLIYKTAPSNFPTPILPSITLRNILLKADLALKDYMNIVLQPLAQAGSAATQNRLLRLQAQYSFQLVAAPGEPDEGVGSETAILLVDNVQLNTDARGDVQNGINLDQFIQNLIADLNTWYSAIQPSTIDATVSMDVILFATINATQLPILQMYNVQIPVPPQWWSS